MTYDFDKLVDRCKTNSYKWDSTEGNKDVLPMWVADMDFETSPAIVNALKKRVEHGIFGYTKVPKSYYEAVTNWFSRRHSWTISAQWIIYTSGVVPAISAILKALTVPGDKVLVQTPVYNCFFSSIRNNGCQMVSSSLVFDSHTYTIDFDDLEHKAADPQVKVMLFCNPHNPAGRVWTREELIRVGEICFRHNVIVVSDEIHCELVLPSSPHQYTPFASISNEFCEQSVTCISPSKAFNIAGLQIANIVCSNAERRAKIDRAINDNEVCDVNPFGVIATEAAYNESEQWLVNLLEYIEASYSFMKQYCRKHLPDYPIAVLEGTYLVWMDCRKMNIPSETLEHQLIADAGLWLNAGTMYGIDGEGFMRWNIACPRVRLQEGLKRFCEFVKNKQL